jgi:hypothetical protein
MDAMSAALPENSRFQEFKKLKPDTEFHRGKTEFHREKHWASRAFILSA